MSNQSPYNPYQGENPYRNVNQGLKPASNHATPAGNPNGRAQLVNRSNQGSSFQNERPSALYGKQPYVSRCTVSTLLLAIAIITYVVGFVLGIFLIDEVSRSMRFITGAITWGSAFVSGTLFLGFSEVVQLLYKISLKN